MPLTIAQFVTKWKIYSQTENAGSQSHFNDLCEVLGEKTPAEADSAGERYAFQKHVGKTRGGKGFADVWMRDHFAWEYKGKHKDLKKAYNQLNDYREELGNPPLLVVCDLERFEVHTNFTATTKRVYEFTLDDLNRNVITATCPLKPLDVLRALFGDYNVLRPERTDAYVTQEAAKLFSRLAERLELENRNLGASREEVAHFLMRLLFCLFADSIGLLPNHLFRNLLVSGDRFYPKRFLRKLRLLFEAMSEKEGIFGEHTIKYFNGGLFDSASIIELDIADLGILYEVAKNFDWSRVAPAIFGTLFERSLDPKRRSLIGAHYTSEEDILLLIEPVVMRPLERRWAAVRQAIVEAREQERAEELARGSRQARLRVDLESEKLLAAWIDELTEVRVLDPACGSGNFLYVALRRMLDLWLEATRFAAEQGISLVVPKMVSPTQLFGIETEFYAHELASIVVWIGFLQWKHEHGVIDDREPILQKLENIEHGDAILRYDADGKAYEPEWPKADFIVGNPPFLGDKKMRGELDTPNHPTYTDDLRRLYKDRVPGGADLVTFWFEKSRDQIAKGAAKRAGLLATNSISMVGNRLALRRIKESGDIFLAWSDRPWTLEGAAVRVSMVGFDNGLEVERVLDGNSVQTIFADLTAESNVVEAVQLEENEGLCFLGMMKGGPFELSLHDARKMLDSPVNPNGRHNSDVIKRRLGGQDVGGPNRGGWIIDFVDLPEDAAAMYELPFDYVKHHVKPLRNEKRDLNMRTYWWLHGRRRPALREALSGLNRYIATPEVSKHRLFVWVDKAVIPDHKLHVFPRADDYFFGVLHSSSHEAWTIAMCSWIGKGNDPSYNSDSTFLTFPFPWPPGKEPREEEDRRVKAIADAARELVRLRDAWLNPPGASQEELKGRTLTNLYNKRPDWLANAHRALDVAVFAAYGWPADLTKDEILARLLALNHERAAAQGKAAVKK
jgi:type II restriction/modification system DNA methylase subunit YeeA